MEIMIVVVIIGLLVTLAVPTFNRARNATRATIVINDLKQFRGAFETYALEEGEFPPDTSPGSLPEGMVGYLSPDDFESGNSLNIIYDWNSSDADDVATAAIGISGETLTDDIMSKVDDKIDDGDLSSGSLTGGGSSWELVLEE